MHEKLTATVFIRVLAWVGSRRVASKEIFMNKFDLVQVAQLGKLPMNNMFDLVYHKDVF